MKVTDAAGTPLSGQGVGLTSTETPSGANVLSFATASGSTDGAGLFTTTASAPVGVVADFLLTATSPGDGGSVSGFTSLSLQPASLTVALSSAWVRVGGSTTVTATAFTAFGSPLPNATVTFSGTGLSFAQATGQTDGSGVYSTKVTSQNGDGSTVSVKATSGKSGAEVTASATLATVFLADGMALAGNATPVRAPKGTPAKVNLTATVTKDGKPVIGQPVTFSPASGGGTSLIVNVPTSVATDDQGVAKVSDTVSLSRIARTWNLSYSASLDDTPRTDPDATVTFSLGRY